MLREFRRSVKAGSLFLAILMLLFFSIILVGCGDKIEKETAEAAKYGDIVSDINYIFDSPEEHEAFLGLQYYHGEAVQLLSTEDGSLCLLKADKSREILAGGADLAGMACFLDIEGNCYCWETDSAAQPVSIRKSDADGNQLYSVSAGDGMQVSDICQMEDGRIYLLLENTGTGNVSLSELNSKTGVLSKVTDISLSSNGVNTARYIAPGSEGILVIEAGATEKITEVNLKDGTREDVLSFVGTTYNLGRNKVGNMTARDFRVLEDGSVELLWADERGICLRESLRMSLTDKTSILVRTNYYNNNDSWLANKILEFNQENSVYHVVLDYPDTDNESAYTDMTRVELGMGKGPDILLGYLVNDLAELVEAGVFEDLAPYMEASGIREEDYFPAAFGYLRDEEKIHVIAMQPYFHFGWLSAELLDGGKISDMEGLVDELLSWQGGGSYRNSIVRAQSILADFLESSEDFWGMIDWERGTCDFGCRLFSKMLEAAGRYGCTASYYMERIMNWQTLGLCEEPWLRGSEAYNSIFDFDSGDELAAQGKVRAGVLFDDGWHETISIGSTGTFAINANSYVKEGAWEFILFLLREENQEELDNPVHRATFMAKLEKDLKLLEEDGRTWPVHISGGAPNGETYIIKDVEYTREDITDERIAEYIEALETARYLPWKTKELLNIIQEEAEYYFEGTKSIEEVNDIINNRVNLYLGEHR